MSEPKIWSHTRLQATRCPWRFKAHYIDHKPEGQQESAGGVIHAALERYADHCRDRNLSSDLDAAQAIAATLPGDILELHDFTAYCGLLDFNWSSIIGFEKQYTLPLTETDSFTGVVDLAELSDGCLKIYDYKTFWGPKERPDACPLQLQRYAWLVGSQVACDSIEVSLVYLPSGMVHSWQVEPVFELDAIKDALTAEVKQAKELTRHHPVAGSWCRWCGYKCPLRDTGWVIKDDAAKDDLACRVVSLEGLLDQWRSLLRVHVKESGPATAGDRIVGYFEKDDVEVDWMGLTRAVLAADVALQGVIGDKRKLAQKGVQKKLTEAGINSDDFCTVRQKTVWGSQGAEEDD